MTARATPRPGRTGQLARVYDRLTAPLERRALARWRRALWALVPGGARMADDASHPPRSRAAPAGAPPLGLEVGAGTGANIRHYPPGARVVATDVSAAMLREARRKIGEAPASTEVWLVAADASRLPFRDAAFDWGAETLVFCEVPDPVAGLGEAARVLRPGAPLLMLEHVRPHGWLGRAADLVTRVTGPLWGEHFDRDAAGAARRAGLTVEREQWLWRDVVTLLETRVRRTPARPSRHGASSPDPADSGRARRSPAVSDAASRTSSTRYLAMNRRSMRSLSHHAQRACAVSPCQRRSALPVRRVEEREVMPLRYVATEGVRRRVGPALDRDAQVRREHRALAHGVHAGLRHPRVVAQRHAVAGAPHRAAPHRAEPVIHQPEAAVVLPAGRWRR